MKTISTYFVRTKFGLTAVILFAIAASGIAQTHYYVSPTGNNANNGLSAAAPKLTIAAAFAVAVDGDMVNLANGTYNLTGTLNFNKSVSMTGQTEAGVIIDGHTIVSGWILNPNRSNISLSNFTVKPNGINGGFPIHVSSNTGSPLPVISNISLSHITINGSKKTAFDCNGVNNLSVSYLTATNSISGNGVQVSGCRNVNAGYITTSGNAWGGFAIYVSTAFSRGSDNVLIDATTSSFAEPNSIYNQNESGYTNTNLIVNGYDYTVQNTALVGYTYYFPTKPTALAFAAAIPNPALTSVKQLSTGQWLVASGMKIQTAINAANPGDLINVDPGTYAENVTVNKGVEIRGSGQAVTKVIPSISNTDCSSGSLCAGASNVFLVQASNVTIDQLTVDGDNPALTSGKVAGGADIDARNGIITDYTLGIPFNNLNVHDVTVQNIFLRAIYASSGGTFSFDHNTVANVQADGGSIALFNFGGSGSFTNNTVSDAADGIVSNWSKGTIYKGNTVTNSASGIHTDNNGGSGGVADLIQNNRVSNSTYGGYGIWVFAPYQPVTVKDNTVSNVDVGLAAAGQQAAVTTVFSGNTVDGQGKANSTGVYITTDLFGYGTSNNSTNLFNNTITNNTDGVYLESESGRTLSLSANNNAISHNGNSNVTQATGASGAGVFAADMNCNWWGSALASDINASINGAGVVHSSWLATGVDADASASGFQPAGVCAGAVSDAVVMATTNIICYGAANGTATISFANGIGSPSYAVDGGSTIAISGSSFTINGLAPGSHSVIITDAGGNIVSVNFIITQPAAAPATITVSNADAFCNKITLMASAGTSYQWKSGSTVMSTHQELSLGQANGDGVYSVTVTANGCTSAPVVYTFNKQYLINSYTILAIKEMQLGENNTVATGSVGVTASNGEAKFHKNSSVSSPGSFVKAKKITRDGSGIVITNPIYAVATGITLPTMYLNTVNTNNLPNKEVAQNSTTTVSGNYKNLTLKKGSNTTLTGNTFGTLKVEQGARVTFTDATINIDRLQVVKGPRTGYSYVRFAPDTKVLVSGSVSIGSQVYINPDNNKVTFYMGDKKSDDEKFTVKGGDTKVTANIYMLNGKLKVTGGYRYGDYGNGRGDCDNDDDDDRYFGQGNSYVYMTGLFITEEVEGNGKNVVWNSFDCSAGPVSLMNYAPATTVSTATEEKVGTTEEELKVTVMPNPSTTYFTLKLESKYATPVELRVIDGRGRVIDSRSKLGSNSTVQIGVNYSSGTYYAELVQGTNRKVVQLVKMIN